jgi:hypothetical protein
LTTHSGFRSNTRPQAFQLIRFGEQWIGIPGPVVNK